MAREGLVPVGASNKALRSLQQQTSEGNVHVEAVCLVDPDNVSGLLKITNADPSGTDYGLVMRLIGAVPLPSGSATETTLAALNTKVTACNTGAVVISSGTVSISGAVAVTGTFWQATQPVSIAATVAVDGSGVTQPVSVVSLPLPAGASTSAAQTTGNSSLSSIDGKVTACNTGAVVLTTGSAAIGTITDGGSGKTLKSAVISLTATGTVVAAVGGKRIKVYAVKLICSAALSINWRDGASTALEGVQSIAINGGYAENVNPPSFLFGTTAGNSLDLVITGVGTVAGRVSYWDDDGT